MLDHGFTDDDRTYHLQTLKDNLQLFTPEILDEINHAQRQMDQIEHRVIHGETIPHDGKIFSIFQPHTEWLSKGKQGFPLNWVSRSAS